MLSYFLCVISRSTIKAEQPLNLANILIQYVMVKLESASWLIIQVLIACNLQCICKGFKVIWNLKLNKNDAYGFFYNQMDSFHYKTCVHIIFSEENS